MRAALTLLKRTALGILVMLGGSLLYGVSVEVFGHGFIPFLVLIGTTFLFFRTTGLWGFIVRKRKKETSEYKPE